MYVFVLFLFYTYIYLLIGMILILIFAEALGLYGLIVALILSQQSYQCTASAAA
jgi:hypothetical protein